MLPVKEYFQMQAWWIQQGHWRIMKRSQKFRQWLAVLSLVPLLQTWWDRTEKRSKSIHKKWTKSKLLSISTKMLIQDNKLLVDEVAKITSGSALCITKSLGDWVEMLPYKMAPYKGSLIIRRKRHHRRFGRGELIQSFQLIIYGFLR